MSQMPDEKKARLEAIRAANRARKEAEGGETAEAAVPVAATTEAPAAPAAVSATAQAAPVTPGAPATTTAAPTQQRPAARGVSVPKPPQPIEDDPQPIRSLLVRAAIGAVLGMILCVLLASMTGEYLLAAIWGLILGAITGMLVLSWPPQRTTSD